MLHVVWDEAGAKRIRREGRNCYAHYLFEWLDYAGIAYVKWDSDAWMKASPSGVTILIGASGAGEAFAEACRRYCAGGNAILAVGDTYGLEQVFGVERKDRIVEGWIDWQGAPLADGLKSSFHFFEGRSFVPGDDAIVWGKLLRRSGVEGPDPAVVVRRIGSGVAALLAFDLMHTVCLIQQGMPVVRDGNPAPDGTGPVNDGFYKTDDGTVLDWERDRDVAHPEGKPFFLHPIVDEMRILFVRLMYWLQEQTDRPFAHVWFWPDGLNGIGHISHDTDANNEEYAMMMLDRLKQADIRSTWCIIMPGYGEQVNRRIVEEGHEVALHFNALEQEIPESAWSEEHFRLQLDMLKEQFPEIRIVSNKNHYLRWEGDVQFYHWCERANLFVEQSKGGTKQGNKGFTFGTCHPYLPVDNAANDNRLIPVVNMPTLAWDPPTALRCTAPEAFALLERSADVYGVAHFLFHPQTMGTAPDDEIGKLFPELADAAREKGMAWWTAEQIWEWFRLKRQVRVHVARESDRTTLTIAAAADVRGLTVLVGDSSGRLRAEAADLPGVRRVRRTERFGREVLELVLDAAPGITRLSLGSA